MDDMSMFYPRALRDPHIARAYLFECTANGIAIPKPLAEMTPIEIVESALTIFHQLQALSFSGEIKH